MTWGMHAVGYIELEVRSFPAVALADYCCFACWQDYALAASNFNRSFANVQQPFGVVRGNSPSRSLHADLARDSFSSLTVDGDANQRRAEFHHRRRRLLASASARWHDTALA